MLLAVDSDRGVPHDPAVDRRSFLFSSLACAMVRPLTAEAQPAGKVWRLGVLSSSAQPAPSDLGSVAMLYKALRELGYVEGRNLVIERRYAEGKLDRLAALAQDLVEARVDVLVAVATTAIGAARNASQTIPIVMGFGPPDPVALGFVKSLAAPGGNITGVTYWAQRGYEGKRLELLKEMAPQAVRAQGRCSSQAHPSSIGIGRASSRSPRGTVSRRSTSGGIIRRKAA